MASSKRRSSIKEDAAALASLGHVQELKRNHSFLSMLGLAFAILNSWTALAASLSLALPSGGPDSVIWGLITGGHLQSYHWVAVISWKSWVPILSWITGWINTAGWVALTATGGLLGSQLIVGIISFMVPSYAPQRWHQFLIYIAYNIFAFLVNGFMNQLLPLVTKSAFTWSIAGFVIICVVLLACASPQYQSADLVFRTFINQTGWPDGLAWLLGLLQGGLGLTGFDAVAHMIEEIPDPSREGPKIMIVCVAIGMVTGFIFLTVLLFVSRNIDDVITSTAGPVLQIFYDATATRAGSICLLMFPLICLLFATTTIMTTSSRMTYAFARDGGLPASRFFAKVHKRLDVPLNALYLTTILVIIFGCIFLGSSSAFNAIVSASVVALGITYAIPPAINCLRGRKMLPKTRAFVLPGWFGWTCNLIGITYVILTTCIVAFAIILVISTLQWFVDGKRNFSGPKVDVDAMRSGEVMGISVDNREDGSSGGSTKLGDDEAKG